MKSYCHPDLNNLPTEQAPTLKENKEFIWSVTPSGKAEGVKVCQAQSKTTGFHNQEKFQNLF